LGFSLYRLPEKTSLTKAEIPMSARYAGLKRVFQPNRMRVWPGNFSDGLCRWDSHTFVTGFRDKIPLSKFKFNPSFDRISG
jgi:hypothetical protein